MRTWQEEHVQNAVELLGVLVWCAWSLALIAAGAMLVVNYLRRR